MAFAKKITFTVWADAEGKRVKPRTPGATKQTMKTKCYYAFFTDPRTGKLEKQKGHRDKKATEELARKLERCAERTAEGIADRKASARALAELLDLYAVKLQRRKGRDNHPEYVALAVGRLRRMFDACAFQTVGDISGDKLAAWLSVERGRDVPILPDEPREYTRTDAAALCGLSPLSFSQAVYRKALPTVGKSRKRRYPRETVQAVAATTFKPMSAQTAAAHLKHVRSFWRWLVDKHGATGDPFKDLAVEVVPADRKHRRRPFTPEEFCRLIEAAEASEQVYLGLAGIDRARLYQAALWTGLRARALGGLTPEMFHLAGPSPEVRVPARLMKGKRDDHTAKLPAVALEYLRGYLAGKDHGKPVWPGPWAGKKKAAELLRRDMKTAGIPYKVLGPHGETVADFHAIRHTAISEVSKLDLITAKQFAAHSSVKTTECYADRGEDAMAAAAARLGNLAQRLAHDFRSPVLSGAIGCAGVSDEGGETETRNGLDSSEICACVLVDADVCKSEDDGTRTRNHRIDSPVL
jgi:site-specific recombinase XerC